jgi:hypothetical protein
LFNPTRHDNALGRQIRIGQKACRHGADIGPGDPAQFAISKGIGDSSTFTDIPPIDQKNIFHKECGDPKMHAGEAGR